MNTTHPRWQDLLTKLLHQEHVDEPVSEVEPYQAQPALGLDLGLAWNDAVLPGLLLADGELRLASRYPGAWAAARHQALTGPFPCCIGLAPQFLQSIQGILNNATAFLQQPVVNQTGNMTAEQTLDNKTPLSQLAIARLAGDHGKAAELIPQLDGELLQQNERAAQLWLEGDRVAARQQWDSLDDSQPVIAFNQGLAALVAGDTRRGRECLTRAAKGFSDTTGWHHLAELYLALAQ
ncbi:MAG TPA: hypothetical protein PLX97_08370 [Gemmatales bacterium]|nr:hypothetical protein [Gemmatales bacterium]